MKWIIPSAFIFFGLLAFMSFDGVNAFFSNRGQSQANIFTAIPVFPTPTPSPTSTPVPTATPIPASPGDVVINEINWAGSNTDSDDEWIELRNTTGSPINLNAWTITNLGQEVDITITDPLAVISANGYFLIAKENKTDSRINVDPDLIIPGISLRDLGEQLVLKDGTNGVIDTANTAAAWYAGNHVALSPTPLPAKSMERVSIPGDGTLAGSWQTATTHTNMDASGAFDEFGTPKVANGL